MKKLLLPLVVLELFAFFTFVSPADALSLLKDEPLILDNIKSTQSSYKPSALTEDWTNTNLDWGLDVDHFLTADLQTLGTNLYAGFANSAGNPGELWRYNGTTWTQHNTDGFGNVNNVGIYALGSFNGNLVAGTYNTAQGGEVWQYYAGWGPLTIPGMGDINNEIILAFEEFNGYLYVATGNRVTGTEIWRSNGSSWSQVNVDGFGDSRNEGVYGLEEYNSYLYAATVTDGAGARVYRYNNVGNSWTQVNTDGFGDPTYVAIYDMTVHDDELYVCAISGINSGVIWKYDGSTWIALTMEPIAAQGPFFVESLQSHNNNLYAGLATIVGGQVWRWNGVRWAQVSANGFGSESNIRVSALESYDGKLIAGAGSFGSPVTASVWSWDSIDPYPIYRFWNNTARHHFYTISEEEKDLVIANYPEWAYEGIAFYASPTDHPDLDPVYRFWSNRYRGHFYTISEDEKNYVSQNLSNDWIFEGVAYYAASSTVLDSMPLYRFWSDNYRGHFYTVSEAERDSVMLIYSHDWLYEGTAYNVF